MSTVKRLFVVIFAAYLLVFSPSIILADGGANPQPPAGNYKYAPPPYMGNVTVEYASSCTDQSGSSYNGCALITGTLKRAGKEGDQFVLCSVIFEVGVNPNSFSSHTAKDLQGRRILGPSIGVPGNYEIIAAHSLFYNVDYTLFTVDLIVMEIVPK